MSTWWPRSANFIISRSSIIQWLFPVIGNRARIRKPSHQPHVNITRQMDNSNLIVTTFLFNLILLLFFKSTPMILRIELSNSSFSSSITFDDSEPRESNFYINFNYDIKFIYIYIYIWIHLESLKNWTLIWKSVIGSLVDSWLIRYWMRVDARKIEMSLLLFNCER